MCFKFITCVMVVYVVLYIDRIQDFLMALTFNMGISFAVAFGNNTNSRSPVGERHERR